MNLLSIQLWNPVACHGNWAVILEIEKVQRTFTRRSYDIGLLTYRERLQKCEITTVLERQTRGDLIVCFKIWKGIVNYILLTIIWKRSIKSVQKWLQALATIKQWISSVLLLTIGIKYQIR